MIDEGEKRLDKTKNLKVNNPNQNLENQPTSQNPKIKEPEPRSKTSKTMAENADNPMKMKIPSLERTHTSYAFGRMDSDFNVVDHAVQIDGQDTLSGATYDQMQQLTTVELDINRANFIRMWKSIILRRVQDVYEKEKKMRPPHIIRLGRNIEVPAPLSDLLYSFGEFHSQVTGKKHHVTPPAQAAAPPAWWELDNEIVGQWTRTIGRLKNLYVMKEFPAQGEWEKKPLMLTLRHVENHQVSIKAWTNEPSPSDGYIRAVNDELFPVHAWITYANASLIMTQNMYLTTLIGEYVGCYVKDSNS